EDCIIKLWDLGSGRLIKNLTGHTGAIYSLAFSQDGNQLASGSADLSVRVWDPKSADQAEVARESVPRSKALAAASPDQLGYYPTKKTPVYFVQYTPSNILLSAGPFQGPKDAA
ncbi:Transcription initiation factor TFIID subunit 5, partial [Cladochytrium tenue]